MYHFVAALKARDTLTFKDRFQGTDVLLIDDFQFLRALIGFFQQTLSFVEQSGVFKCHTHR